MQNGSAGPDQNEKPSAALTSDIFSAALVALKLAAGAFTGSVSIISESIHSCVDLFAPLVTSFAVRTSRKPADGDHPFGHGKVENLSCAAEALMIFLASGWIIFHAWERLQNPEPLSGAGIGLAAMLFASLASTLLSQKFFNSGEKSYALDLCGHGYAPQANLHQMRSGAYTSALVTMGIGTIWLGSILAPGIDLRWVDPAVAILVALIITKTACKLTLESARDLIDARLPPEEEACIRKHVAAFAPTVRGIHRLRTRKSGESRFVEFHMRVEPTMSIDESHRIADMITCSIKQCYPGTSVNIHTEPCNCALAKEETCGCFLKESPKQSA